MVNNDFSDAGVDYLLPSASSALSLLAVGAGLLRWTRMNISPFYCNNVVECHVLGRPLHRKNALLGTGVRRLRNTATT